MPIYHIAAQQSWPPFSYQGKEYSLQHLDAHKITFRGDKHEFSFVVTYGLHCFAKDEKQEGEGMDAALEYFDGRESRPFSFERYELSKQLPYFISNMDGKTIKEIGGGREKYRIVEILNKETNETAEYKIGFCCFKENRLLRIHVTTAFLEKREGLVEGKHKNTSIFNIGVTLNKKPKRELGVPKEAQNKRP